MAHIFHHLDRGPPWSIIEVEINGLEFEVYLGPSRHQFVHVKRQLWEFRRISNRLLEVVYCFAISSPNCCENASH